MFSEDIFNYAVGVLAIASALVSIALCSRSYLPGAQMKALDEVVNEIKDMYIKAQADGVLPREPQRSLIMSKLAQLDNVSNELRIQAYNATSPFEEYLAMLRGLSLKIKHRTGLAKKFRAYLLTASEEERRSQQRTRNLFECQPLAASNIMAPSPQRLVTGYGQTESVEERPLSCPATIPGAQPDIPPQPEAAAETLNLDATSRLESIDFSLDGTDGEQLSRSSTLVNLSTDCWVSIGVPFTKLRWCFEYPNKESSNEPQASRSASSPDVASLPV
ncbi:hypothetical protein BDQ17DRAFT_1383067 [Cyathus striatus]|nr:hypothetical protein BDQ17DRAFT_1383067 [Cyathus striatus]